MKKIFLLLLFITFQTGFGQDSYEYQMLIFKQKVRQETGATLQKIVDLTKNVTTYLNNLDIFPSDAIKRRLIEIAEDYANFNLKIQNQYDINNYRDGDVDYYGRVGNVLKEVLAKSKEIVDRKDCKFLLEMKNKKKELEKFITDNNLTKEQIEIVTKNYQEFLLNPFREDSNGNYIVFVFETDVNKLRIPKAASGFIISFDGLIVTNNHVVDGANKIFVKKIINNNEIICEASKLAADFNNDLALLRLNDPTQLTIKSIPFIISQKLSETGEDVFVLGYPLTPTMGEELKVTTGIISSKTGFKGDITCYQISAAIQPGNSGSPMFDKDGNIIGIISGKHRDTENVSYAIKSNYLLNLLESLRPTAKLNLKNSIKNKSLVDKIKAIENLVVMIVAE